MATCTGLTTLVSGGVHIQCRGRDVCVYNSLEKEKTKHDTKQKQNETNQNQTNLKHNSKLIVLTWCEEGTLHTDALIKHITLHIMAVHS